MTTCLQVGHLFDLKRQVAMHSVWNKCPTDRAIEYLSYHDHDDDDDDDVCRWNVDRCYDYTSSMKRLQAT